MVTIEQLLQNGFDEDGASAALAEAPDLEAVELPDPLEFLTEGVGLPEHEAVDLLCELPGPPVQNAFYSAAQRRWYFANLGKKGGPAGKGGAGNKGKAGKGGGGKAPDKSGLPAQESPAVKKVERHYPPANPDGNDTFERHRNADGSWTPERKALHDEIVKEMRGDSPARKQPVFTMMGGGPASGKSSVIKSGQVKLPNGVTADSDEIKGKLPEYGAMLDAKDNRAANYAHEESSYLAKRVVRESFEAKRHVTLDGTGNSKYESVKAKVEQARAAGYKVNAVYVTCSTEEAVRRNVERAKKTGRLPPEEMLRNTHRSVSQVVPQAIKDGLFDNLELWDTENQTGGKPTLVVTAKGKDVTIHNQALWEAFVAKGK